MENEINWQKTKAMVVKRGGGKCNIAVNGVVIESVRTMKYLGAMLEEERSCESGEETANKLVSGTFNC